MNPQRLYAKQESFKVFLDDIVRTLRRRKGFKYEPLSLYKKFSKVFLTKMVFEGRATTQTKNAKFVSFQKMLYKKNLFLFAFFVSKRFFFVKHFLKRYKLLVFLTKMVFLKRYKQKG